MKCLLALDQGTTSSRAILFDEQSRIVAMAQREFTQHFPQPGWVEHDPLEIWETQRATAQEAIERAGVAPSEIAGIGITNQRETTVVWNRRTGLPVCRAIVWQDRRTAEACGRLRAEGRSDAVREKTGLVLDPYFSGTKLQWILEQVPGVRAPAEAGELAFGTIDSWLVWKLTEGRVHVTDASNASRTLLLNLRTGQWDPEMLALFGVPPELLPRVGSCSEVYGTTRLLGGEIPICGMAGDQQAALFGQACLTPGLVKNTYGTGCFMLMHVGNRPVISRNNLLTTIAWKLEGEIEYALEGSVFIGGAVIQWLRDGLGLIASSREVEALAGSVPDSGGVYCVPAFTGLGAPHWDPYARGALLGLTRGTTRAHIARAALESIALQSHDLIQCMEADAGIPVRELRVDGGASANRLLMQLQADLLGHPVVRPRVTETTALGAAYLAGLSAGVWKDRQAVAAQWESEARFMPQASPETTARLLRLWNKAVDRTRHWEEPAGA